jgi:putative membrane protein
LLFASALFFGAAFFASRFPDVPGASAGSYVSTFLIALPAGIALFLYLGARRAVFSLLAVSIFAFTIEATGVVTGFPYGDFYYGDALGPRVFGLVPYLLPVSYAPLVIGTVAATAPLRPEVTHPLFWVLRSAALLVLMDGVLDPGATALGFWVWPDGGAYHGVPLSNYAGWLFSGALVSALLLAAGRWGERPPPGLLDSAIIAMAFWTGVAMFEALILPSALGVGLFAFLLWRRSLLASVAGGQASFRTGRVYTGWRR